MTNHRIRKIAPDGVVTTVAGTAGTGSNDGIGQTASFNYPMSVGISPDSKTLYVADSNNYKIRSINSNCTSYCGIIYS